MTGWWLNRSQTEAALKWLPYQFAQRRYSLETKKVGKKDYYFVSEDDIINTDVVKNKIPVQLKNDDILDQLEDAVEFTQQNQTDIQLNRKLKQAKIKKLQKDIDLTDQKIQKKKSLLFEQWSQKFFQCFSQNFLKLKNVMIELHLNEEQINLFNQTLDVCLNNLALRLEQIKGQYLAQKGVLDEE